MPDSYPIGWLLYKHVCYTKHTIWWSLSHFLLELCMNKHSGFTLIELLVTLGIAAILAGIAIPSYTQFMTRGYLAEGQNDIAGFGLAMEQVYQNTNRYDTAGSCAVANTGTALFAFTCVAAAGGQSYTVTATSRGKLTAGHYVYTLNSLGERGTTKFNGATSTAGCWLLAGAQC